MRPTGACHGGDGRHRRPVGCSGNASRQQTVPLPEPQVPRLREFLAELRSALGSGRTRFLPMPMMRLAARWGHRLPGALRKPETLEMLNRGNYGNTAAQDAQPGRSLPSCHCVWLSRARLTR